MITDKLRKYVLPYLPYVFIFWFADKLGMHIPVALLIKTLNKKLTGHYNCYGVTHNSKKMGDYYQYVKWQLLRTLKRRSQRDKTNWDKLNRILERFPVQTPKISVNIWTA